MDEFCKIFKECLQQTSKKVYDILRVITDPNINIRQVHEDGVSSVILKELSKMKNKFITLKIKSLDVNENTSGMDFDIWIGENDQKFVRLVVQAKSFETIQVLMNNIPLMRYNARSLLIIPKMIKKEHFHCISCINIFLIQV